MRNKAIVQNKPQPGFSKESAAFSVAWGDSPAAASVFAGNEQDRRTNVCEFTAVWGSPVWEPFLTDGWGCCAATIPSGRAVLLQSEARI
jgi:hypothetical protein